MSRVLVLLLSGCIALLAATQALAERRALVIGNDAYVSVDPLRNAVADAKAMARALEKVGFKVAAPVLNADRERMLDAITRFAETLGGSDEAVVFYAGHAVEMKGVNYLLPVDIRSDNERSVQFNAVPLHYLLSSVVDQKPKFSLMVIDACRDNPFRGNGRSASSRGLVPAAAAAQGQMVIYSASDGQKALDRLGSDDKSPNGVFTRVFVTAIETPGIPIHEAMRRVKSEVKRLADSVKHRQLPAIYDASEGEFYFNGRGGAAKTPVQPRDEDAEAYEAADGAGTVEALQHYLEAFPKGRYAAAARIRIASPRRAVEPGTPDVASRLFPPGREFEDCIGCPKMVVIPEGEFDTGIPGAAGTQGQDRVHIGPFALGKYEVTQRQWNAVMGGNPSEFANCGDDCPVETVSWRDAKEFIAKLNERLSGQAGSPYRLPSEAEWEYACRGGKSQEFCGSNHADDVAWYERNSQWRTKPIGTKSANGYGIHDMSGNVSEWTEDCWRGGGRGTSPIDAVCASQESSPRVVRGGAWSSGPARLSVATRDWQRSSHRSVDFGFRVARTLP